MTAVGPKIIRLEEYVSNYLPREAMPYELGIFLYETYRSQVKVDFPSHPTGNQWRLTSQGWVGYIPLSPKLHLSLTPKVSLGNLFKMLDLAYRLDIHFLKDLYQSDTLQDYYDRLASILAKRIMDRARKGFYRSYEPYQETLPYLRERVDMNRWLRSPWKVNLECEYHEHTADIEDNQILAWTLYAIGRSGLCSDKTLALVRKAYHELEGYVSTQPYHPSACAGRLYHRLNEDYRPLHALSRFFLEQSGPSHRLGDRAMVPFLIDMAQLFELFVAEWLKDKLPDRWSIKPQEKVDISEDGRISIKVDLVLVENETGRVRCVLDTKYKNAETPSNDDLYQVVAYAETLSCEEAVLIYPMRLQNPFKATLGRIRVRSLAFDLAADLDQAGQALMKGLLGEELEGIDGSRP